ncbi:MAG TPA: molybdopterin-dependent oxidoreductase [Alphaproteobacteria bacterium]|nr:molybdopterin-dependent oxidoreductase [Alphaproteobacteria bacterium]
MRLSRRSFLKASTATGAAVTLSGPTSQILGRPAMSWASRQERWVPSVCLQCPAGCGILVRVVDGRAVKIEGHPTHPINEGKLCPKGHIGLQILYDPDRIKGPLKRVGPRGAGQWQPISWEDALQLVATRLTALREHGEPHHLVFMSGRNRGQMGGFIDRFLAAYGSPNHVGHSSICADGSPIAHYLTQGFKAYAGYDWDRTNYLLCFGAGFVEAWRPTTRLLRAYGHMRRGRPIRAKIVQIDTRFSVSAAKADEWIPINPGTDAALALAIAHVILVEGLWDRAFVGDFSAAASTAYGSQPTRFRAGDSVHPQDFEERLTFGLAAWWNHVLKDFTPQTAAAITGVPAETIVRLAREFATTRPAIAAGERGASMQTNGIYNRMAIHALNALVGSIDVPGGVLVQVSPPLKRPPAVVQDAIAKAGVKQPRLDYAGTARYPLAGKVYQGLPEFILGEGPYPVDTVFLYYTNPLFSSPAAARFRRAFEQVPFIVDFTPFMSESAEYADLILPDHTYLERWHDDIIYPSLGYPVVSLRQPVVSPLYDTRSTGDALIQLAKAIGGSVADSFPWRDYLDFIRFTFQGLHEAQTGTIVAPNFEAFWEKLLQAGFWAHPPYPFGQWGRVLHTPSKKFEFFSQTLQRKLEELAQQEAANRQISQEQALEEMLRGLKLQARGEAVYLPHYEPIRYAGDPKEFPLLLNTYKTMAHAEGRGANSPWLQQIQGLHVGVRWDSWVEINPATAKALGIADGDQVWIESPLGRIRTQAKLYPGAMPHVVNIPFEQGHTTYGRWAKGRGVNPNVILVNETDHLGGLAAFFSTRVKVYKA